MGMVYDGTNGLTFPDGTYMSSAMSLGYRNVLINGRGEIDQVNAGVSTTTTDASYGPDGWKLIGEDNNGKIQGQDTTTAGIDVATNGTRTNIKVVCVTASKKYGIVQFVEGVDSKQLRGKLAVFSFTLHVSNARLTNMKSGIIEWGSTEDTITSDPVSIWGAGGTTPTLATNFTFKNTPASHAATTTPVKYYVSATLGTTFNNLAVMVWHDGAAGNANDEFYVTDLQLEAVYGSMTTPVPTPYEWLPRSIVLQRCHRYLISFDATATNSVMGAIGQCWSSTQATIYLAHPVRTRTKMTGATFSGQTHFQLTTSVFGLNATTAVAFGDAGTVDVSAINATVASGLTAGNATMLYSNNSAAKILLTGARL